MKHLATALIFLGCLTAIVLLAVFADIRADDLVCLGIALCGTTALVIGLISGRSLDDVL